MTKEYIAIIEDEHYCESLVTVRADNIADAREILDEDYPNSIVMLIEDKEQRQSRIEKWAGRIQRFLDDEFEGSFLQRKR